MAQALYALQQFLNALQIGGFYALLAASYVILHGVTNRFNLALGALATWAGYIAIALAGFVLDETFYGPAAAIAVAALGAGFSAAGLGLLAGRAVFAPLIAFPPLATLIATIGLALAIQEAQRLATKSADLWLAPIWAEPLASISHPAFPVRITTMQAGVFGATIGLAALLGLIMRRSRFGRSWRAVADDPKMASLLGVDVAGVIVGSSVLAALYAAATGTLVAIHYGNITFYNGFLLGLKALFVAVAGGLSSFSGALVGGLLIGGLETFWSAYFPIAWRDPMTFVALTAILVWRRPSRIDLAPPRK